jgi:kynurenine formamidase
MNQTCHGQSHRNPCGLQASHRIRRSKRGGPSHRKLLRGVPGLDLTPYGAEITEDHLRDQEVPEGYIILLKTENSLKGYDHFREDYAHLTEDGANYLVERKTRTVGSIT